MSNEATLDRSISTGSAPILVWAAGVAIVWTSAVILAAGTGLFDVPADSPAIPTLAAIAVPVVAFSVGVVLSARLRAAVLALDPVLLTELQAWRILGGLFLAVYAFGHLPGFFAWPAGVGDVAVGIAAPFMAWQLRTNPAFLTNRRFRLFNYFGLADFVIAVATGVAARNHIPGLVDGVTSSAMGQVPLVLIPTIAVPAFIILHLIVLMQVREARR